MSRPDNVGILCVEVYFPQAYVDQAELEGFDGVSAGKYTKGLGQKAMAFAAGNEDAISMSLTVVQALMDKYSIAPQSIGRLEVGSESGVDRSKSIKSFLMTLFRNSGNTDIQGVDCVNACYGGTAALFNAVNWVESRSWDGRFAIVVAADMAMYAAGPARASGGCGAVAMLIGPDAPLVLEPGLSATYMDHVYDFYKPAGAFPTVDGKLSIDCYLTALDHCFAGLCQKAERQQSHRTASTSAAVTKSSSVASQPFSLADVEFCVMHAPLAKMVRKGFARLAFQDAVHSKRQHSNSRADFSREHFRQDEPCDLGTAEQRSSVKGRGDDGSAVECKEGCSENQPVFGNGAEEWQQEVGLDSKAAEEQPGRKGSSCVDSLEIEVPKVPGQKQGSAKRLTLMVEADATCPSKSSAGIVCSEGRLPEPQTVGLQSFESFVEQYARSGLVPSLDDKALEKAALDASAAAFERVVQPGMLLGLHCGNSYAASVYASLASLLYSVGGKLAGKRVLLYSYGSGLAATLYCIRARHVEGPFSLGATAKKLDLEARLAARRRASPEEFTATLALLELEHGACDYSPTCPVDDILPGVYFLDSVDKAYRRFYKRKE